MAGNVNNIRVYKKRTNLNIGVILFSVILVYLIVTILTYVTAKHVSVYEVREGSILKDNSYTGLVIREEVVVNANDSGYINFFATEGSKVGKLTNVFSISPEELSFETASEDTESEETQLTSEEQNAIILKAQTFSDSYQDSHYSDAYQFKESVSSIVSSNSAQSRQAQLETMMQNGQAGLSVHTAADDGIIIYSTDGYEDLELSKLTKDMISKADYQKNEIYNNTKVSSGDPIYKLVTSEDWTLIIELDSDMAEELAEATSVKVNFKKDNQTTWASFKIKNVDDINYGILSFDHSMVRYAGERFLDIELILEDESGLKIPKSAVVEKDFYLVPEDFITQGGNSSDSGVLVQGKDDTMEFQKADIYYRDTETGMVYLEPHSVESNTVIVKPDSGKTYTISETATLSGVYNINKGYAVFRQIHILCESDEYYIVESGNTYGLSNYDHIALDGDMLNENDVVF